ncbi:hypothetical protein [Magnetococcus marinus]|nr:hypothetical protein [Magnetococcus marinus]
MRLFLKTTRFGKGEMLFAKTPFNPKNLWNDVMAVVGQICWG